VPAGERDAAAAGSAPLASAAVPRARCPVSIATRDELCVLDGSGTIRYLDSVNRVSCQAGPGSCCGAHQRAPAMRSAATGSRT
jgi:hypothetical protein